MDKVQTRYRLGTDYRQRKTNSTGHLLHRNRLLEHVIEGKIGIRIKLTGNEEEEISSYWMI
jgi:hypothetical protein